MEAVHHLGGPCLVLAGAGSGKTRVITHKIARLLQAGYAPKQIAAITFTNKAAQEMRERAKALVGPRAAKDLVVSTFHSLGVRILRSRRRAARPEAAVQHPRQRRRARRAARRRRQHRQRAGAALAVDDQPVEEPGPEQRAAPRRGRQTTTSVSPRSVMQRYEERLAAYQAVDFDDLIGLPLRLLQRDDEARAKWQDTLRYVLVDEYQDTNAIQYELLKPLVGERAHVHRGRRRRPEHLRLARRDDRQPAAPAAGLPAAEGHPARAELPLDRRTSCARPTR